MGKGMRRRDAREAKYMPTAMPKLMIGLKGKRRDVYPEPKPTRHGQVPEKPERTERWQ